MTNAGFQSSEPTSEVRRKRFNRFCLCLNSSSDEEEEEEEEEKSEKIGDRRKEEGLNRVCCHTLSAPTVPTSLEHSVL